MSSSVNHILHRLGVTSRLFFVSSVVSRKGTNALPFISFCTGQTGRPFCHKCRGCRLTHPKMPAVPFFLLRLKKRSLYLYHSAISFLGIFSSGKGKKIRRKCALLFGFLRRRRSGRWTEVDDARFFQLILFGYVFHEHALFVERHFDAFFRC